jgi:predicted GIY-YIG superfamily endonuclease
MTQSARLFVRSVSVVAVVWLAGITAREAAMRREHAAA